MRTNLTTRSPFLALFMTALIFSTPFTTLAQQISVEAQAKMAAERDAETDTNKLLWTGVSCAAPFCGLLGGIAGLYVSGLPTNEGPAYTACFGAAAGCLVPISPILSQPIPPPERLLGKSPEYVDFYTNAYETETRRLRIKSASRGGIIGFGLLVITFWYHQR